MYRLVLLGHRSFFLVQCSFCRNHRENGAAPHTDTGRVVIPNENVRIRTSQPQQGGKVGCNSYQFLLSLLEEAVYQSWDVARVFWRSTMSTSEHSGRQHLPETLATPRIPCFFAFYFNLIMGTYHLSFLVWNYD